jgi:phosphoribosylanthranilate isomerase
MAHPPQRNPYHHVNLYQDLSRGPIITVTGADERTDLDRLKHMHVEVGILYSVDREGKEPRYPSLKWILDAARKLPYVSLHVCGKPAREQAITGSLGFDIGDFQRMQVNGPLTDEQVEIICNRHAHHKIITQWGCRNGGNMEVDFENHAVLVDGSGGNGILPTFWMRPKSIIRPGKPVGFAGGLGPDNLVEQLKLIRPYAQPGWWIDMEAKVRTDDWFDLDKVEQVINAFEVR